MTKQLIFKDARFWGKQLVVPHDGNILLGPQGEVTVSAKAAQVLLTVPHWVDPNAGPDSSGNPESNEGDEHLHSKLHFEADSSVAVPNLADLEGLEIAQLLEIAAEMDLKVPAPMRTNKKSLTTYVRNQLQKRLG